MHGLMSYRCSEGFNRYTATELRLEPGCYVATERDERSVATWNRIFSFKYSAWNHNLHRIMYPLHSFVKSSNFLCPDRWSLMFRDSKV
ncbi:hypothetical protein F2Q70_00038192 [Brassica cretica]|uniref:Uncharacterized protein n=1 Tax=Brassica cretica TaxID=69181 RepID=A0A8S9K3K5_BRACR|nr:hypothetical protein F2Q70_00038192 [Brassica cretica]